MDGQEISAESEASGTPWRPQCKIDLSVEQVVIEGGGTAGAGNRRAEDNLVTQREEAGVDSKYRRGPWGRTGQGYCPECGLSVDSARAQSTYAAGCGVAPY